MKFAYDFFVARKLLYLSGLPSVEPTIMPSRTFHKRGSPSQPSRFFPLNSGLKPSLANAPAAHSNKASSSLLFIAQVLSMVTERIWTSFDGRSCAPRGTLDIFSTTSYPSTTSPNTVCLLSSQDVSATVIKNWLPLVFGPELAMDSIPFFECRSEGWNSSANL